MTKIFTPEEKKYVEMGELEWEIKTNCPERLMESLKKKLELFNNDDYIHNKAKRMI